MKPLLLALLALAAAFAAPGTAMARDNAGVTPLLAAPAALKPDAAYLLIRVSRAKSGLFPIQSILLRVPGAEEIAAYRAAKQAAYDAALPGLTKKAKGGPVPGIDQFPFDYKGRANTFAVGSGKFLEDGVEMRTVLLEVPVGTYVLYGVTVGDNMVATCNCLGTVQFAARPGVITDVGSLYADKVHKPSPVPHLEDNLGEQMFQYAFILGQALVPAEAATPVPASLRALPLEQAKFEVVGQFYESGAQFINRLAPIPGLLGYEHGKPVDLRTGRVAE